MFQSQAALVLSLGMAFSGLTMNLPSAHAETLLAQAEMEFEVGDRLEIERQGQWRSGEVMGVTADDNMRLYDVRFLDVGFIEEGVLATRLRPVTPATMTPLATQAQPQTSDINLDQPVYVERNGEWLRARILYGVVSFSGTRYAIQYQGDRTIEENVLPHRIRNVEVAQTSGISSNTYDLSSQAGIDAMLAAHNYWRSQAGVPELVWSDDLAEFAQDWAEELASSQRMQHNPNNPDYGENLATGRNIFLSPEQAVNLWGNEVADYNYANNRCAPGKQCGHYTQIVWEETTEVGCGMVRKNNGWEIWVCNYDPPGNYVGERPY
ncbi:SCP-like extracellular [[Leptolyngbya] sp. PCC 7376]|uniref:pathogenesis-related family 1 protein n=1 Tax=[Leptolyngbya] sp. PCC 7376 TaxID=111781 RepID=UPI00029EC8EA|nr:pathogenesis-related family 1 protein [[Leptolyngbya] sp. PCC 7376]AFY40659.1 SCP-like extracellular [[Leptolyngbya] sp. PCC 7376]